MVTKSWTTIKVDVDVKKRMDKLKIHPRQSYNEVIEILLDHYEKTKDKS